MPHVSMRGLSMNRPLKILLDFDGTLCKEETIPFVAERLGLDNSGEIRRLTSSAAASDADYDCNLRRRVYMMKDVKVDDFVALISEDLLRPSLAAFVGKYSEYCEIVSCNLDCWCNPLAIRLGVKGNFTPAIVKNGKVAEIGKIVDKASLIGKFQNSGYEVVFVGDSANDIDALSKADIGILLDNGFVSADNLGGNIKTAVSDEEAVQFLHSLAEGTL